MDIESIIDLVYFGDDQKVDVNKYGLSTELAIIRKISSIEDNKMLLSKLKDIQDDKSKSNDSQDWKNLKYKLKLDLDYVEHYEKANDFDTKFKLELAAVLNIDTVSITINSVNAGSGTINISITINEKATNKLVSDHVLTEREFGHWSINRMIKGKDMEKLFKNNDKNPDETTPMWQLLKSKYSKDNYEEIYAVSKKKYEEMKLSHESLIEPLSFDQIAAIHLYTIDSPVKIYKDMEQDIFAMRSGFADYACELIAGIRKLPMFWGKTYRGFGKRWLDHKDYFAQFKEGNILRLESMNSSSTSQYVAGGFARSGYGVEIEGYHGRDISPFSAIPDEQEIVFMLSTHIMITGSYTKKDPWGSDMDITWFTAKEMAFPWDDKAVLWVDDKPQNNKKLMEKLEREGKMIIPRVSNSKAVEFLGFMKKLFLDKEKFDQYRIITDMNRNVKKDENDDDSAVIKDTKGGAKLVRDLRKQEYNHQVCIYTSDKQHALDACKELIGNTKNIIATTSADDCYQFASY